MDYYRRYIGDYLADTQLNSAAEDGMYGRMLDYYYATEKPLPVSLAEVYRVARAANAADRKAVSAVLERHFVLALDGYHNTRADKELGVALPQIAKLRENARINGAKGGRPPTKTKTGSVEKPALVVDKKPELVPTEKQPAHLNHPPTASHQPENLKPPSEKRFPGRDGKHDSAATFGAAALERLTPPGPEADVRNAEETPAGMLAAVCNRNSIQAHAFHPLIVEWARDGFNVEQLKAAISTARHPQRKGDGRIPLAYLDPILRDVEKPKRKPWRNDDHEAEALCKELGIKGSKPGEDRTAWHERIEKALAEQTRQRVA